MVNNVFINSTLLRSISDGQGNEKDHCPRQIFHYYIERDYSMPQSQSMINGVYMETMMLGSGVRGNKVTDLEKTKTGKPTAEQMSIDYQVNRFKKIVKDKSLPLIPEVNTQVRIYKQYKPGIYLFGELDWFPVPMKYEGNNVISIVDIKLTKNVDNPYGEYCWGKPEFMDLVQADIYFQLVMDVDFNLNDKFTPSNNLRKIITDKVKPHLDNAEHKFFFWVFGYPKNDPEELQKQFIVVERDITNNRVKELGERIRWAVSHLEYLEESSWPAAPDRKLCSNCSVSKLNGGYCPSYHRVTKV